MHVPFNDLGRHAASLGESIERALASVAAGGWYVMGPEHDAFEAEFAAYCGASHCLGVGNGTDALEIALRALGCGPGDEVVTVANAGMYTTTACLAIGCVPVFVDVEPTTLLMDPDALDPAISDTTRAIVVTHLYGRLADMDRILAIARARGVPVVEDCAQSHGATRATKRAGTFGDVGTFSFYPTKNLGAIGDGGAIVTGDASIAERVRLLRQYGWESRYRSVLPGGRNSRLDELQAAVLRVKLPRLDGWNARRRDIAASYAEAAEGTSMKVLSAAGDDFVAHLCVGTHPDREAFRESLSAAGVETAVHFPTPDHRQPSLAERPWRTLGVDVSEWASEHVVSLPCFPELTPQEVDFVCETLRRLA